MPNDKKRLIDLDLNGNEIQNGVDQNLATAPSNPKEGQFYWNTVDKKDYQWDGEKWVDRTSQGRIYTEGAGIDITGTTISIDDTVVATKTYASNTYVPLTTEINGQPLSANVTLDADDVGALADTTKYATTLSLNVDSLTYVLTATLKDQDGNTLGTTQTVDLPIESLVLDVDWDSTTNELVIELQNGTTTRVPIGSIISGLQSEIISTNKLDADLVDDSTSTNKFVTATQKSKIDTATQKLTVNNPALTASSGVCTWTITNTLGTADVNVVIREVSTNDEVVAGVTSTASTITIKMNSTSNILADTYRAVVIG